MTDKTITVSKEELNLIRAAIVHYRLAGFPLGRSSYSNNISHRDRREWAAFGMEVYNKLINLSKASTDKT
jgi:hypothetical protein